MPLVRGTRYAPILGGGGALLGVESFLISKGLQGESDILAFDGASMTARVKDTTTPANAFRGDANDLFTYTNPSTKWIRNQAGIYVSGTTLRTEYDVSGNPLGIRVEPTRTNLALHSDDFTQEAAWTLSDIDAAKTATGPDGVANSASTLTATDANGTALQAITSASAARITSCFIRRRTGSGNIDLTQDNGDTWTTVTVTSEWTRVSIDAATVANPTVGIRIVTSGDAVDVAFFQHEVGAFVSSPIRTAGSAVTRNADNVTLATSEFPFSETAGTIYIRAVRSVPLTSSGLTEYFVALNDGSAAELLGINSFDQGASTSVNFRVRDDNGEEANPSPATNGTVVAGTMFRIAAAYAEDDFAIVKDGGTPGTDNSGTIPTPTVLRVGGLTASAQMHPVMHWRELVYVPRRMTNTDLQAITSS